MDASVYVDILRQILLPFISSVYPVGMGDIDILAYDYCEASISRLSRLLN